MTRVGTLLHSSQCFRLGFTDGLLDQQTDFFVLRFWSNDSVPLQDPARVSVHDKYGMVPGVEQDGVRGLWPNAVQSQQLSPQFFRGPGKHAVKRSAVFVIQKGKECFEISRLLAEISRWTDQVL